MYNEIFRWNNQRISWDSQRSQRSIQARKSFIKRINKFYRFIFCFQRKYKMVVYFSNLKIYNYKKIYFLLMKFKVFEISNQISAQIKATLQINWAFKDYINDLNFYYKNYYILMGNINKNRIYYFIFFNILTKYKIIERFNSLKLFFLIETFWFINFFVSF